GYRRGRSRQGPPPTQQQLEGQRATQAPPDGGQRAAPPPAQRGSVESLVARQNVLLEEFTSQQSQALVELQRSVQNLSGRITGTGAGGTAIMPKAGVFLDVPNLMYAAEQAGVRVHFGKLLSYLTQGRQLIRATAY